MRLDLGQPAKVGKRIAVALCTAILVAALALIIEGRGARVVAQAEPKLEATIFSYDGKDFIRTKTTLVTQDGTSAVDTKLDHATLAYKALVQRHSYVGESTVFGRKYDADYAPLISSSGKLTGALFVAVPK